MENLKLTRIDFRLIHGQVMTRWVAKYEIESIVVIDDRSAKSPILKKILLGAAPSGVKMCIRDRDTVDMFARFAREIWQVTEKDPWDMAREGICLLYTS